jgi:nitric oxide dioxygenase
MDKKTVEIVKSTAPVLQENSKAIGKRFYELLFGSHPELYNLFLPSSIRNGSS